MITPFRTPADNWFLIVPKGNFPHGASGLMQVIDDRAVNAMHNRFKMGDNRRGLLVDYDHFSYDPEKSSEAAGWIVDTDVRADGLWGKVRWTPGGQDAVARGSYRFFSPTFLPTDCESLGNSRIRPLRVDSAALTNNPNFKTLQPISNRKQEQQNETYMNSDDIQEKQRVAIERMKREKGCKKWSEAYEMAQIEYPELFKGMAAPLVNREAVRTERDTLAHQNRLVSEYRNRHNVDFDTAWSMAQSDHPEVFGNRASNLPDMPAGANHPDGEKAVEEYNRELEKVRKRNGTWSTAHLILSREQPALCDRATAYLGQGVAW